MASLHDETQGKHPMEKDKQQNSPPSHEVRQQFDSTLARHIERLIGTSKGIADLNLDSATISSLVLLAERESEIEELASDPPERYTRDTFFKELEEVGLDSNQNLKTLLQDMTLKGYLHIDPEGRFLAKKPAVTMVKLLDQALPAMPGMNLVAYLVQTVDEVLSGRKELESGVKQFDQTLEMHGVALKKEAPKSPRSSGMVEARHDKDQSAQEKAATLSELFRRRQAAKRAQPSAGSAGQPVVLSADGERVGQAEVREEVFQKTDESEKAAPMPTEHEQLQEAALSEERPLETEMEERLTEPERSAESEGHYDESAELTQETPDIIPQADSDEQDLSEAVPPAHASPPGKEKQEKGLSTEPEEAEARRDQEEPASEVVQRSPGTGVASQTLETATHDDTIESRVAAFEEDLAMSCPLCSAGRIHKKQTTKSKFFYVCSNGDCIFISWGKPYHLACPWCKNPFLIEATDKAGELILRCPRATCRYRQKPPWEMAQGPDEDAASPLQKAPKSGTTSRKPRKRVVRRRRVRRKR
jgi:hypothetical protein